MGIKYYDEVDWSGSLRIATGSIIHTATDNKTTENTTGTISLPAGVEINSNNKFLIKVQTPVNDTAANAVVTVYNQDAIDGTNTVDIIRQTTTVANVSATSSYKDMLVEGLFVGSNRLIKLGVAYATDTTSTLESAYSIYRI